MSSTRVVVSEEQARERLDKTLALLLPEISRATIQRWIEEGRVLVDGKPCRARDKLRSGACVEWEPGPAPLTHAVADASVSFSVLYEDADLIVVDKPAGLVVHPAKGHDSGTLVNGLLSRFEGSWATADATDPMAAVRPGIVHRIDKDTSGVLVVARTDAAREGLKAQLQAHTMGRRYLALTLGVPTLATVNTFYGRHPQARLKWTSRVSDGKVAVSHFRVLEIFGLGVAQTAQRDRGRDVAQTAQRDRGRDRGRVADREHKADRGLAALVECRLETGRTHQIRVHMAEQCHTPLLADSLYGRTPTDARVEVIATELGRQALHAQQLSFVHPITGQSLSFTSELPSDFERALSALRRL
ncbi:MAG: pseudouridine synthase [Polyangiaceae bacterium]